MRIPKNGTAGSVAGIFYFYTTMYVSGSQPFMVVTPSRGSQHQWSLSQSITTTLLRVLEINSQFFCKNLKRLESISLPLAVSG